MEPTCLRCVLIYYVPQIEHDASREEIEKCFSEIMETLPMNANEEETVTQARAVVQGIYEELMEWLLTENVDTLKQARLEEAKRIINASSDLKALQV